MLLSISHCAMQLGADALIHWGRCSCQWGCCTVWCTVRKGHTSTVRVLLHEGADIHGGLESRGLRSAAPEGHFFLAKQPLNIHRGPDVYADDKYALRSAAHEGHSTSC